jgi:hypothetical protein
VIRRASILIPLAALLVAVGASTTAAAAPPAAWATSVCSALETWRQDVDAAAATAAAADATDAKSAKKALTTFLAAADGATGDLVASLKQAGAPSGSGGKMVASTVKTSFAQVDRAIAQAKKTVTKAKTNSTGAFVATARGAQDAVEAGLESSQAALGAARFLDSAALLEAFNAEPACADAVAPDDDAPALTLDPTEGPPGTEIAVSPAVDGSAVEVCIGSSAFRTELLGADGAIIATGAEAIAVPANATPGVDTVRLICYLPEVTGRRVLHGLCAGFVVTGGDALAGDTGCPPAPRVVAGQVIVEVAGGLSNGFNPALFALGG